MKTLVVAVLAMATSAGGVLLGTTPAHGVPTDVASACAYYVNLSLFGTAQGSMGCAPQTATAASTNSLSPSLNDDWSNTSRATVDSDGAKAQYGPAVVFSSPYLAPNDTLANSGQLEVATWGDPATLSSTARAKASGVGPSPFWTQTPAASAPFGQPARSLPYDGTVGYVESTCSGGTSGASGSTTIKNGFVDVLSDLTGAPLVTVPVPTNPPANFRVDFYLTNVGDRGHLVFNEQVVGSDGSLSVTGAHMYMEGPTAIGDLIIAKVHCPAA